MKMSKYMHAAHSKQLELFGADLHPNFNLNKRIVCVKSHLLLSKLREGDRRIISH